MIRILSIDGGGIRGLVPAQVLVAIEKKIREKTGNVNARVGDYFDLVAGTNAGGILACALLLPDILGENRAKYSAEEIMHFFLDRGPDIFDIPFFHRLRTANGLLDEKYPEDGLVEALDDYFGDATLQQLIKPCIVPAYDIKRRKAHFFSTHEANAAGKNFYVKDVARATFSMPTYFECSYIESLSNVHYPLADGSLVAYNPAMCAFAEACVGMEKKNGPVNPADEILLLSLGSGSSNRMFSYENARNWGMNEWTKPLMEMNHGASAETVDFQLEQMYKAAGKEKNYLRINPVIPADISDHEDDASSGNMNALAELGTYTAQEMDPVLDAFVSRLIGT